MILACGVIFLSLGKVLQLFPLFEEGHWGFDLLHLGGKVHLYLGPKLMIMLVGLQLVSLGR